MIASLAIILPMSTFAEDQGQNENKHDKKNGGNQKHGSNEVQQAQTAASIGGKSHVGNTHNAAAVNNAFSQSHTTHVPNGSAKVHQAYLAPVASQNAQSVNRAVRSQSVQQTQAYSNQQRNQNQFHATQQQYQAQAYSNQQRNQAVAYSNQQQYNRDNNYGGLWFASNTHNDWNRDGQHYYNHHHYRWYEGGWLIIDSGYNPYYTNGGYSNNRSTARNVQASLADQGYYRGPIDGDIGPGSRNAIANYQSDYGLRVTGRINDALLESLRL